MAEFYEVRARWQFVAALAAVMTIGFFGGL
jgi:hypothetical protein